MPNLSVVELHGCDGLAQVELGCLTALQQLHITRCNDLQEVAGLGRLAALRKLKAEKCGKLRTEASLLSLPPKLQHLDVHSCGKLTVPGLEKLVALTALRLSKCPD
jgi:hypothetical protein